MRDTLEGPSGNKLLCFAAGLVYWGAIVGLAVLVMPYIEAQKINSKDYTFLGYALIVVLGCIALSGFYLGIGGLEKDKHYASGTYGQAFRFLLVLFGFFVVIPTVFWTGRGLLRKFTY